MEGIDIDMSGELNYFRKRFFGGFNRQDVIDYVSKLAQERNELRIAKEKTEQELQALAEETASLRHALDEAKMEANKNKTEAIEAAIRTVNNLESDFSDLRKEVESKASGVRTELEAACNTLASVPSVLERAEIRVAELRATLDEEKEAAIANNIRS